MNLGLGYKNITAIHHAVLKLQENSAQTAFAKIALYCVAHFFTSGKSYVFL